MLEMMKTPSKEANISAARKKENEAKNRENTILPGKIFSALNSAITRKLKQLSHQRKVLTKTSLRPEKF